jgi:hypothetical protein
MSKNNHPIEQEELMAYLDGELATNRAVAAAAHLDHCAECQELTADLKKLSQELMAWEVEQAESEEGMRSEIVEALEKKKAEPKHSEKRRDWRLLFKQRSLAWGSGFAVLALFVLGVFITRQARFEPMIASRRAVAQDNEINAYMTPAPPPAKSYAYDSLSRLNTDGRMSNIAPGLVGNQDATGINRAAEDSSEANETETGDHTVPTVPMIARVAGITLSTKEFDKTRASLEEILKRHNGYMGELKVSAPADSGRSLTATLRIPAQQLDAAMTELKKLGRVEDESQGGEEVTQQYVDLQARLANGIHTEQRLTEILRTRTGKLQDVLKVELEIDRVRGEIEQMQAEKKELSKRVAFATLNTTIREEYQAKLQATPPSTGSRFRNAAVDGYNTVIEGLIDVLLFLLSAGPSLLLWAAILFFPARWAWKKFQAARRRGDAEEESV